MLVRIDAPFADVRAADLGLALDSPPQPALETLRMDGARFPLELRLLGSSHQAIVKGVVCETVACGLAAPGSLPAREHRDAAGAAYAFTSRVQRLEPTAYAAAARRAIGAAAADPHGLAGIFPGPGDAFTALRAAAVPRGVTWDTWHGYPQTGELVVTRSVLREPA